MGISLSIGNVLTVPIPVTHSPNASLLGGIMPPPCCPGGEEGACVYVWLLNGGVPSSRPVGRGRGAGSKAGHEQRFPLCALDMPKYTRDKIKVEIPPWLLCAPRLAGGSAGGARGGAVRGAGHAGAWSRPLPGYKRGRRLPRALSPLTFANPPLWFYSRSFPPWRPGSSSWGATGR